MTVSRSLASWWFKSLLAASVIGLVLGSPLGVLALGSGKPVFLLGETVEDTIEPESDRLEYESGERLAIPATFADLPNSSYCWRVADHSVDTQTALAATRHQRGPPLG